MKRSQTNGSKESEEIPTPLANIWRQLCFVLQIRPVVWNDLINTYLDTPGNEDFKTARDRSGIKNRITSQLSGASITWNRLTVGLKILRFSRCELIFRGWRGKSPTPIEVSCKFIVSGSKPVTSQTSDLEFGTDSYFISKAHRYSWIILFCDSEFRNREIGLTDEEMTSNKDSFEKWYKDLSGIISAGKIDNNVKKDALNKLKTIYENFHIQGDVK